MVQVSDPWTPQKVIESIASEDASSSPSSSSAAAATDREQPSILPFFHMIGRLKTTKREGWRRFGIYRGESIADHMYRMSIISMFAPPSLAPRLDLHKCMKMCLVHDMAELLVGDITPVDGVPKPEKSRREAATMDLLTGDMLRGVPGAAALLAGADIRAVWQEYEDSRTLDSHYVHDIDKVELLLQMVEYERAGKGKLDLGEFAYVATKVQLPEMKERADEIIRERERFWDGKTHIHGDKAQGVSKEHTQMSDEYYSRE